MRIDVSVNGRKLYAKKDELVCDNCGKRNADNWFYYTLTKKVYCSFCAKKGRGLPVDVFFQELIFIDNVEIEDV